MRVGFLTPPRYFDTSYLDFLGLAPEGTEAMTTYIPFNLAGRTMSTLSLDHIREAVEPMKTAARMFADADVDLVAGAGSPYSLVHAAKMRDVANDVERAAGVPTVLMGASMLDALDALGANRIAVAGGYFTEPAWVHMANEALTSNGFEVTYFEDWVQQGVVPSIAESDRLAWDCEPSYGVDAVVCAAQRCPEADAVIVFGGGVRMVTVVAEAEERADKPVVSGDVALFWAALRRLGVAPRLTGWGRLIDGLA